MSPYAYGFDEVFTTGGDRFFAIFMTVYIVFFLVMYAYSILVYILHALGLYTIAMRRGIRHPWLAWVPLGDVWILGSIADQYQYVAKGRVKNRRKVMIGLSIAVFVVLFVILGALIALLFTTIGSEFSMSVDESQMLVPLIVMLASYVLMMIIALVLTVMEYVCYYNLFQSCDPNNGTVFLVLSIFFSFLLPFFVFAVRKKDLGMPPRKSVEPAPVMQPVVAEPVVEPVYAEPVAEPDDFVEEESTEE